MLNISSGFKGSRLNQWIVSLKGHMSGGSSQLPYLYQQIAGFQIKDQQFAGRRQVLVSQIAGSAVPGRCRDFDAKFRLSSERGRERLQDVARAWQRKKLPPVALIQVGEHYFVQDGHHRVAICKANQQESIMANVILLELEAMPTIKSC